MHLTRRTHIDAPSLVRGLTQDHRLNPRQCIASRHAPRPVFGCLTRRSDVKARASKTAGVLAYLYLRDALTPRLCGLHLDTRFDTMSMMHPQNHICVVTRLPAMAGPPRGVKARNTKARAGLDDQLATPVKVCALFTERRLDRQAQASACQGLAQYDTHNGLDRPRPARPAGRSRPIFSCAFLENLPLRRGEAEPFPYCPSLSGFLSGDLLPRPRLSRPGSKDGQS